MHYLKEDTNKLLGKFKVRSSQAVAKILTLYILHGVAAAFE